MVFVIRPPSPNTVLDLGNQTLHIFPFPCSFPGPSVLVFTNEIETLSYRLLWGMELFTLFPIILLSCKYTIKHITCTVSLNSNEVDFRRKLKSSFTYRRTNEGSSVCFIVGALAVQQRAVAGSLLPLLLQKKK